jgi:hypothetical protein
MASSFHGRRTGVESVALKDKKKSFVSLSTAFNHDFSRQLNA